MEISAVSKNTNQINSSTKNKSKDLDDTFKEILLTLFSGVNLQGITNSSNDKKNMLSENKTQIQSSDSSLNSINNFSFFNFSNDSSKNIDDNIIEKILKLANKNDSSIVDSEKLKKMIDNLMGETGKSVDEITNLVSNNLKSETSKNDDDITNLIGNNLKSENINTSFLKVIDDLKNIKKTDETFDVNNETIIKSIIDNINDIKLDGDSVKNSRTEEILSKIINETGKTPEDLIELIKSSNFKENIVKNSFVDELKSMENQNTNIIETTVKTNVVNENNIKKTSSILSKEANQDKIESIKGEIYQTIKTDIKNETEGNKNSNSDKDKTLAIKEIGINMNTENYKNTSIKDFKTEVATIVKPQDIIETTVKNFKTLKLPGYTEVKVKLKPQELGEITLKLILEKGKIDGVIIAQRKEVADMINNQMDGLKQELKNNNINLNNLSVDIDNGYSDSNRNQNFERENKKQYRQVEESEVFNNKDEEENGFNIIA